MAEASEFARNWLESLRRLSRNAHVILSVLAVLVGVAAGVAAIGFRYAIDGFQRLGFGFGGEQVVTELAAAPWWRVLVVPLFGGLAVGLFVRFLMPERRPHAVADVIEANALRGGRMSLTTGLKAALVSAASIGTGASVGREGPVVHLGASLGAWVAKRLHLSRMASRTLLGCGVAAAIAASFNAPIAGTFFALEVVVGHYAMSAFAPIVIAAVLGTLISRMHYGDFPAFIVPEMGITSFWEFPAFALLGLVSALVAVLFIYSAALSERVFQRLRIRPWLRPAAAGLVLGVIGLRFPHVLGVGYEATDAALSGLYSLWLLLLLIVLKTAATGLSLGAGFGGGVFSPSLFIGAMVGGAFGIIATGAFPELSSGQSAYTIVGMGAVAGAVLGAPISTVLMVFELTNDYAITIAVMIATAIASLIVQQGFGRSFFTWQLERRGISIRGGQDIGLLRSIRARDIMNANYQTIRPDAPIAEVRERLPGAPWGELFVVDAEQRLRGIITFADMQEAAFDTSHDAEWVAGDVARGRPTVLGASDDLERAIQAYGASGEATLPVVESRESMRLVGVAREHEMMLAYHRALEQARGEERGDERGGL
ncbi:MAG TPA: chloride channel protein [Kiloniellales bacterium]|nr:chloride channel protein [Kiloniellales bacterium]